MSCWVGQTAWLIIAIRVIIVIIVIVVIIVTIVIIVIIVINPLIKWPLTNPSTRSGKLHCVDNAQSRLQQAL